MLFLFPPVPTFLCRIFRPVQYLIRFFGVVDFVEHRGTCKFFLGQ